MLIRKEGTSTLGKGRQGLEGSEEIVDGGQLGAEQVDRES